MTNASLTFLTTTVKEFTSAYFSYVWCVNLSQLRLEKLCHEAKEMDGKKEEELKLTHFSLRKILKTELLS